MSLKVKRCKNCFKKFEEKKNIKTKSVKHRFVKTQWNMLIIKLTKGSIKKKKCSVALCYLLLLNEHKKKN